MTDAKWIIPAPVWEGTGNYSYRVNGQLVGSIEPQMRGGWYGCAGSEPYKSKYYTSQAEARAWVEAEVMKQLGAEVHRV